MSIFVPAHLEKQPSYSDLMRFQIDRLDRLFVYDLIYCQIIIIETHESTSKNCALVDGREEKQASLLGTHGGHDAADNPHNGGNCAWGGVNLLIPKKLLNRTL